MDSEWEARKASSKTAIMTRDMQFAVNVKRRMSLPNSVIYKHLDGATAPVISLSMGICLSRAEDQPLVSLNCKGNACLHTMVQE